MPQIIKLLDLADFFGKAVQFENPDPVRLFQYT